MLQWQIASNSQWFKTTKLCFFHIDLLGLFLWLEVLSHPHSGTHGNAPVIFWNIAKFWTQGTKSFEGSLTDNYKCLNLVWQTFLPLPVQNWSCGISPTPRRQEEQRSWMPRGSKPERLRETDAETNFPFCPSLRFRRLASLLLITWGSWVLTLPSSKAI